MMTSPLDDVGNIARMAHKYHFEKCRDMGSSCSRTTFTDHSDWNPSLTHATEIAKLCEDAKLHWSSSHKMEKLDRKKDRSVHSRLINFFERLGNFSRFQDWLTTPWCFKVEKNGIQPIPQTREQRICLLYTIIEFCASLPSKPLQSLLNVTVKSAIVVKKAGKHYGRTLRL